MMSEESVLAMCAAFMGIVVTAGLAVSGGDGCPLGKYNFVIDSVSDERDPWRSGMQVLIDDHVVTVHGICGASTSDIKQRDGGSEISAQWQTCAGEERGIALVAQIEAPMCVNLRGDLRIGESEHHSVVGHLRSCVGDPDVTKAQIKEAVDAESMEDLKKAWVVPEEFTATMARVQARLGCAMRK